MRTKNSLKNRILKYLIACSEQNDRWISKSHLEYLAKSAGYLGDNCSRRLRELTQAGSIEVKFMNGQNWYRYQPYIDTLEAFKDNIIKEVRLI